MKKEKASASHIITMIVLSTLMWMFMPEAIAQDKTSVQIKTFTPELRPLPNIEVSINDGDFLRIGTKGTLFTELAPSDFPIKSVRIKDDELEAASWLFSKGVVEIVVRKKSYHSVSLTVKLSDGRLVTSANVTYTGKRVHQGVTDQQGKIAFPLALGEKITSVNQLTVEDYDVRAVSPNGNDYVVTVDSKPELVAATEAPPQKVTAKEYFKDFNLSMLDSIQSLTAFYAIFRNYQINHLDATAKARVDAKFNELIEALQDSVNNKSQVSLIGGITDSTLVIEDIRNLARRARDEGQLLNDQRASFDAKIKMITDKLEAGISNMAEDERMRLLSELSLLEQILLENERRFFKNQNDYKQIITSIKEKYFNLKELETKLSESEARRLEEQRIFRQRLLGISAVVLVFAILVILLIIISRKLQKQKKALAIANGEIKHMNENLEMLVLDRTKKLEEAHTELDTFLYRASHDMRSPVRSIMGLCHIAEILAEGEPKSLINKIAETTTSMDVLLKKLSLISEINRPSDFTTVHLQEEINEIEKQITRTSNIPVDIRIDCPADIMIASYRNLVNIILRNVIDNSVYYGALDNKRLPKVDVKVRRRDDFVDIDVRDNGNGIALNIKDKVFDMFFKGTEKSAGHGLGLYIVAKAVQRLNGSVNIETQPGEFTVVHISLPSTTELAPQELLAAAG